MSPTSSVFHTITRSSQDVGLRGEMSTCSLKRYQSSSLGYLLPTLATACPWGTCRPRARSCPARCRACPGCTGRASRCAQARAHFQPGRNHEDFALFDCVQNKLPGPEPFSLGSRPFISDIATTQMIFLPLVSRASGGGLRGSVVLLELKNRQLQVSK